MGRPAADAGRGGAGDPRRVGQPVHLRSLPRCSVVGVAGGGARRAAGPRIAARLALLLLLAFGLLVWGLDWGLTEASWAADELRPDWVRDVLHQGFGSGWYDKYPWLHYAVLAVPVSAFELADRAGHPARRKRGVVGRPTGAHAGRVGADGARHARGRVPLQRRTGRAEARGARAARAAADAALRLLRQDGEPRHAGAVLVRLGDGGLPAHPSRQPVAGLRLARHRVGWRGGHEGPGVREPRRSSRSRSIAINAQHQAARRGWSRLAAPRSSTGGSGRPQPRRRWPRRLSQHDLQPHRRRVALPAAVDARRPRHRAANGRRLPGTHRPDGGALQVVARLADVRAGGRRRGRRPRPPRSPPVAVAARGPVSFHLCSPGSRST